MSYFLNTAETSQQAIHRISWARRGMTLIAFRDRSGKEIDVAPFGLESGMVFEGATGVHERIYRFNSKKEKEIMMRIPNGFCCS